MISPISPIPAPRPQTKKEKLHWGINYLTDHKDGVKIGYDISFQYSSS